MLLDDGRRSAPLRQLHRSRRGMAPRQPGKLGQGLGDGCCAALGGCSADDLEPLPREFERNRAPIPREAPVTRATCPSKRNSIHASSSFDFRQSCRVGQRVADTNSASMRLTMPASTLPGPHSTTWCMPLRLEAQHASRPSAPDRRPADTGHRGCASGCDLAADVDVVEHRDRGARTASRQRAFPSGCSAAGFIRLEWKGADTGSGSARLAPLP